MKLVRSFLYVLFCVYISVFVFVKFNADIVYAHDLDTYHIVELLNRERIKVGLKPLKIDKRLESAALAKGENMFKNQYWAHYGPNGETPWQFIVASGYNYKVAGENLAKGFSSSEDVNRAWMNSKTHRENMLDPRFTDVGIAIIHGSLKGEDIYLVVEMFGTLKYSEVFKDNKNPILRIDSPKDGEVLPDAAFSIRGTAQEILNNKVELFIDEDLRKVLDVLENNKFSDEIYELSLGDHKLEVRAIGSSSEPLYDVVKVSIIDSTQPVLTDKNLRITQDNFRFLITINTSDFSNDYSIKNISIIYNGIEYLPIDTLNFQKWQFSLPKINNVSDFTVKISLTSGLTTEQTFRIPYSSKSKNGENSGFNGNFILGSVRLDSSSLYSLFWNISILFGIFIIIYLIMLIKKSQFYLHRFEFLIFATIWSIGMLNVYLGNISVIFG